MNFKTFFNKHCFTLLKAGDANWDYYLMQYPGSRAHVVALAKPGSGAEDCIFGSLSYYQKKLLGCTHSELQPTVLS